MFFSVAKVATQLRQQQQCDDDAAAAMLSANANTQQQQQCDDQEEEGTEDGRSEGGDEERRMDKRRRSHNKNFWGGRSIAPYQHTPIASMGARELDRYVHAFHVGNYFDLSFALKFFTVYSKLAINLRL